MFSVSDVESQVVVSVSFFLGQRFAVVGVVLATFFLEANSLVDEVETGLDLRGDWWWSWEMLRARTI
jgi:hypothetical protein